MESSGRRTFVLVDGENIDATLGGSLLNRRPTPEERPRWERVTAYAEAEWGQPVTGLFFLNAQRAAARHVRPGPAGDELPACPPAGRADQKVVDIGLQRTLDALVDRDADVFLCSHDGDFAPQMQALLGGQRRIGLIALREYASMQFTALGIPIHDLEDDVRAFKVPLPRVRVISPRRVRPELPALSRSRLRDTGPAATWSGACWPHALRQPPASVGNTPLVGLPRLSPTPDVRLWAKPRGPQPDRLDQGPAGAQDDRGGGEGRHGPSRLHDPGADLRQHRDLAGHGRQAQGLPDRLRDAGEHPRRAPTAAAQWGAEIVSSPAAGGSNEAVRVANRSPPSTPTG